MGIRLLGLFVHRTNSYTALPIWPRLSQALVKATQLISLPVVVRKMAYTVLQEAKQLEFINLIYKQHSGLSSSSSVPFNSGGSSGSGGGVNSYKDK